MQCFKDPGFFLRYGNELKQRMSFKRRLKKYTPILIYQMGKVGSTSVYKSLLRYYPGIVIHTHGFSEDCDDQNTRILYDLVVNKKNELKIISLVREPISRNISAFFENFERDVGLPYEDSNLSIEELEKIFLKNYNHDIPLQWFDTHIKKKFQIDVYASPFPEDGVVKYRYKNIKLLLVRLENDDEIIVKAIKEFLGLDTLKMLHGNVGSKKEYSETYMKFKQRIKLPESYICKMYESNYFKHFYSEDFAGSAIKKWKKV